MIGLVVVGGLDGRGVGPCVGLGLTGLLVGKRVGFGEVTGLGVDICDGKAEGELCGIIMSLAVGEAVSDSLVDGSTNLFLSRPPPRSFESSSPNDCAALDRPPTLRRP